MFILNTLFLFTTAALAQCYFRDGELAIVGDQSYVQCPGVDFCCLPTDTCGENGLCVDVNNHANGSLTTLSGGSYNFTGLYQTPTCVNKDWSGCETQCSSAQSSDRAYIWSCNDQQTEYCCAGNDAWEDQGGCCSTSTDFELTAANASSTSTSISATQTATSTTSSSTSSTATAAPTGTSYSGLSQGAKIGIGVGITAGVIALATILTVVCCIMRKRKRRVPAQELDTAEMPPKYTNANDFSAEPAVYHPKKTKKPGTLIAEADGEHSVPAEMACGQDRSHELP